MNPIILRQVAESESFRWIVERRHLLEAADTIEELESAIEQLRDELAQERDYARDLRQQAAGKDRP